MTRERAKELLPIIQAFADGKQIQLYMSSEKCWEDACAPGFSEACDYRIKPALLEGWANTYDHASMWGNLFPTFEDAKRAIASGQGRTVHMREVEEVEEDLL